MYVDPGECTDGQVRLANGTIEQEGKVQVCVNGVWSGVCEWGFDTTDAYVFCNSLGYDGPRMCINGTNLLYNYI